MSASRAERNKKRELLTKLVLFVPILFGLLNTHLGKAYYRKVKILLDSGASSTIVDLTLVQKLRVRKCARES